ncbi:hypothetical protein MRX96_019622 [Rhipicephalus microplus]
MYLTKENFAPLGNTHPSTSAWSSEAIEAGGMTSQDTELQAPREERDGAVHTPASARSCGNKNLCCHLVCRCCKPQQLLLT